jgi:hypothetical protein
MSEYGSDAKVNRYDLVDVLASLRPVWLCP